MIWEGVMRLTTHADQCQATPALEHARAPAHTHTHAPITLVCTCTDT